VVDQSSQPRYVVENARWGEEPVLILRDTVFGSQATVVPGIGANCVAWAVPHAGETYEILETPPDAEALRTRKFRAGMPVLFPFPGRVREAQYSFEGVEYHLAHTDKAGVHHIHGLVNGTGWRLERTGANENGAFAILLISRDDVPEALRQGYPFNFHLTMVFTLSENRLTTELTVRNDDDKTLPFGYGLHPYFRAPLAVTRNVTDRSQCLVQIPAAAYFPAPEGLPVEAAQPVTPELDFQQERELGTRHFDNLLTKIGYEGDYSVVRYRDPGVNLEVRILADRNFREWVIFTQPNRPSLCIEPYTCPPNMVNLQAEGVTDDTGLLTLAPGAAWQATVIYEVAS
jgi:aldose 1-epimerase